MKKQWKRKQSFTFPEWSFVSSLFHFQNQSAKNILGSKWLLFRRSFVLKSHEGLSDHYTIECCIPLGKSFLSDAILPASARSIYHEYSFINSFAEWCVSHKISTASLVFLGCWESVPCCNKAFSLNPLSPNSDQQQFSPNNIHSLSRDKVLRINKMIIVEKIPWSFSKFSQLILKGDVWRSVGEFVCRYWGLKG